MLLTDKCDKQRTSRPLLFLNIINLVPLTSHLHWLEHKNIIQNWNNNTVISFSDQTWKLSYIYVSENRKYRYKKKPWRHKNIYINMRKTQHRQLNSHQIEIWNMDKNIDTDDDEGKLMFLTTLSGLTLIDHFYWWRKPGNPQRKPQTCDKWLTNSFTYHGLFKLMP